MKNKTRKRTSTRNRVYKKNDFVSSDGMLTTVWGPSIWHYLHIMSFNYPVQPTDDDKKHYYDFMINLQNVLPCKYCRENLKKNYKELPLTQKHMENRESFSRYVYNLHELINKMLHKKSNLSYCDVRERYEHFRARCTEENRTVFKFNKTMKRQLKKETKLSEKGCTEPLFGKKSKCVIKIVPQNNKTSTFQMDKKCIKTRG
uniref:thiol oxidase n=1 Tax=viral metagenome TaxID=1070528 RepID=A0A6C0E3A8_9ZZZZ